MKPFSITPKSIAIGIIVTENRNTMKRISLVLLLAVIGFGAKAQQTQDEPGVKPEATQEQIDAIKIGFITKKLDLSPDEAQKFWPVYNQYSGEIRRARVENRGDELRLQERVVDIRKRYKDNFTRAVSSDKINRFWIIERQFDNAVQREFMRRKMLQRRRG